MSALMEDYAARRCSSPTWVAPLWRVSSSPSGSDHNFFHLLWLHLSHCTLALTLRPCSCCPFPPRLLTQSLAPLLIGRPSCTESFASHHSNTPTLGLPLPLPNPQSCVKSACFISTPRLLVLWMKTLQVQKLCETGPSSPGLSILPPRRRCPRCHFSKKIEQISPEFSRQPAPIPSDVCLHLLYLYPTSQHRNHPFSCEGHPSTVFLTPYCFFPL